MEHINSFKAAVAAVCAALTALWGWFGWLVVAWIVCMIIDYATGSAAALRAGKWSSKTARDGIWHKLGSVVAVIVAAILDTVIGHLLAHVPGVELPFAYTVLLCPLVVIWYILTEAGSIIENAGALGAPIPAWLTKMIAALESKVDQAGDNMSSKE
ncbi:holin [Flavonifractor sp. An52]|uniref:phage holin family protein n=1 Tax=Flavonifractor sp. An52 TaxID=1965642 RepID=UPI000B368E8E|nr:phage holin family protein [Flavonifractor sp. An52]OUN85515.1 holin [Flavonifractor sp. An52]